MENEPFSANEDSSVAAAAAMLRQLDPSDIHGEAAAPLREEARRLFGRMILQVTKPQHGATCLPVTCIAAWCLARTGALWRAGRGGLSQGTGGAPGTVTQAGEATEADTTGPR